MNHDETTTTADTARVMKQLDEAYIQWHIQHSMLLLNRGLAKLEENKDTIKAFLGAWVLWLFLDRVGVF